MSARKAASGRKNPASAATATATAAGSDVAPFHAKRELPLLLVLLVVMLTVTAPVIPGQFLHWDDRLTIAKNPWLRPGSPEPFTHFWHHGHMSLYVPVTYDVWAFLAQVAVRQPSAADPIGLDPRPFHIANI